MYIYIEIKQVRRNIWKEHKWLYDQPPAPTQNIIKHQIRIEPMTIVVFCSSYQNVIVHVVKLSNVCLSALRWQNHLTSKIFPNGLYQRDQMFAFYLVFVDAFSVCAG